MSETDLARLCLEAHRALAAELRETLGEWGWDDVKPSDATVFMHIDRRSGTRITELARRARMSKQGMMLIVDDLEARGYVRRVPDEQDSRAKLVRLTAKGRRYVADARRVVASIDGRIRRELGWRQVASLRRTLAFIIGLDQEEESVL